MKSKLRVFKTNCSIDLISNIKNTYAVLIDLNLTIIPENTIIRSIASILLTIKKELSVFDLISVMNDLETKNRQANNKNSTVYVSHLFDFGVTKRLMPKNKATHTDMINSKRGPGL